MVHRKANLFKNLFIGVHLCVNVKSNGRSSCAQAVPFIAIFRYLMQPICYSVLNCGSYVLKVFVCYYVFFFGVCACYMQLSNLTSFRQRSASSMKNDFCLSPFPFLLIFNRPLHVDRVWGYHARSLQKRETIGGFLCPPP